MLTSSGFYRKCDEKSAMRLREGGIEAEDGGWMCRRWWEDRYLALRSRARAPRTSMARSLAAMALSATTYDVTMVVTRWSKY